MMEYIYILFPLLLTAYYVYAATGDDKQLCMEIFKEENLKAKCCENMVGFMHEDFTSCRNDTNDTCEKSNCLFKKIGVKIENNTINELSVMDVMNKIAEDKPEVKTMVERTKKFCLNKQYEDYVPPGDFCNSIKLYICAYMNSIAECTKWKQSDICEKVEEASRECKKIIDFLSK